ncbi:hypothetical protein [Clostridium akagii]|uniref:hypothetical protein n=1 Tax=Clostridium akagii TaxID=91623 RepID=UPI0004789778|nr:hypothetical protein [Clostridium akagii]
MRFILYYSSLLSLIVIAYLIANHLLNVVNKDIKEARGELDKKEIKKSRASFYKSFDSKLRKNERVNSMFSRIDDKLIRLGNPIHLNSFYYLLIKILLLILGIVYVKNFFSTVSVLLSILLFFYIDIVNYSKNIKDEKLMRLDFPEIYNALEIDTYAEIPFDKSIVECYDVIKNQRLKKAFSDLSAEVITKKDIGSALNNLKSKFNNTIEINSFALTIEQGLQTGAMREMLGNQRRVLTKSFLNSKDIETTTKNMKVTIAVLLLLISASSIIVYSFATKIFSSLNFLLK